MTFADSHWIWKKSSASNKFSASDSERSSNLEAFFWTVTRTFRHSVRHTSFLKVCSERPYGISQSKAQDEF
eukprot:5627462-Pleurochrysis_carterae.AAC.1